VFNPDHHLPTADENPQVSPGSADTANEVKLQSIPRSTRGKMRSTRIKSKRSKFVSRSGVASLSGSPEGERCAPRLSELRNVIARVPRGKVITYGQVAALAGFPGAARLTVWALQSGEGLPWHRVVGAGGRILLPEDGGREQRLRLQIEGVSFRGNRVRIDLHGWHPRLRAAPRGRQP
jgi:methylated-DNA-protein-cysteine methyltransferase related protein